MPDIVDDAVTVRLGPERRDKLDTLARNAARSLPDLINEAIDGYLMMHRIQCERIVIGLRQADAGEFAGSDEVAAAYDRWR